MANRTDVANKAGVSVATVSNVFNGSVFVSAGAAERVRAAAAVLKYVPNHSARSLSSGTQKHIGIALNEYTNPFHMRIVQGVEDEAMKQGYMVTVLMLDNEMEDKIDFIKQRQFDALINWTTQQYPSEFIDILINSKCVLVNFAEEFGLMFDIDNYGATLAFMKKLRELGHRKVAYINTFDELHWKADGRGRAFSENSGPVGFTSDPGLVVFNDDFSLPSEAAGYSLCKRLLGKRRDFTALFATNDLAAMGAMRALADAGLRVPEDVSLIGCDDTALSSLTVPSLSSISYDHGRYVREMVGKIVDCIRRKEGGAGSKFIFKGEPVFRESVGKAKRQNI